MQRNSTELEARRIPLSGAVNFRDLGGYLTGDGHRVRRGLIYRSDSLAELTDGDIEIVSGLGLKAICDLRHESERMAKPNRALLGAEPITHAIGFLPHRTHEMLADARLPGATVDGFRAEVSEAYRHFAVQEIATFKQVFNLIIDVHSLPMLMHCTSGKDRTGFASALLLLSLGVPAATVLEDFLLSNLYRRDLTYLAGAGMPPALLSAMREAPQSALEQAFEAADLRWGSRTKFLATGLGLTPERIGHLRALLLEAAP